MHFIDDECTDDAFTWGASDKGFAFSNLCNNVQRMTTVAMSAVISQMSNTDSSSEVVVVVITAL